MPAHGLYPMNVRWRPDVGFEMRCEECKAKGYSPYWWPLDKDYWFPERSMTRCRACWRSKARTDERARIKADPVAKAERDREYRRKNRKVLNFKRRQRRKDAA